MRAKAKKKMFASFFLLPAAKLFQKDNETESAHHEPKVARLRL